MPDIFLYPGEANPSDIVLSDPTVPRSGGTNWDESGSCSVVSDITAIAFVETVAGGSCESVSDSTGAASISLIATGSTVSDSTATGTASVSFDNSGTVTVTSAAAGDAIVDLVASGEVIVVSTATGTATGSTTDESSESVIIDYNNRHGFAISGGYGFSRKHNQKPVLDESDDEEVLLIVAMALTYIESCQN